jgi:hypothetical protein
LASDIVIDGAKAPYTIQRVDLKAGEQRSPEQLKANSKSRVPALAIDRGVLTESPVIFGYIAMFPEAELADIGDSFAFADTQAFNLSLIRRCMLLSPTSSVQPDTARSDATAAAMRAKGQREP